MGEGEARVPSPASDVKTVESAKDAISFRIPGLPPSVNSLYSVMFSLKRVELKPEVRLWKSRAKQYVPQWKVEENEPLGVLLEFYGNWFFKNAAFRKLDVQNLIKVVVDAVAEKQSWNDCQVFRFEAIKIQSEEEYVKVKVNKI